MEAGNYLYYVVEVASSEEAAALFERYGYPGLGEVALLCSSTLVPIKGSVPYAERYSRLLLERLVREGLKLEFAELLVVYNGRNTTGQVRAVTQFRLQDGKVVSRRTGAVRDSASESPSFF
jgi:hypothetical protein